jgi:hypothetical protein
MVHQMAASCGVNLPEIQPMPFDTPFMLGPFAVDSMGRLAPSDPNALPAFLLRWRDRTVRARFTECGPQNGEIRIRVAIGRIASTASPHDPDRRARSFALLRILPRALPPEWRIGLLPDHGVRLEAALPLTLPITATALLVQLTCFLVRLAPYLDVLDEAGVAGTVPDAGKANVCPG